MNDEALVLWLDMLGYKNWLRHQPDLLSAETWLRNALRHAFGRLQELNEEEPRFFGIDALLVSDTILLWSHRLDADIFTALATLYSVLHCELTAGGLPLWGALAKGPIRVARDFPHTIVGGTVARCATLEQSVKAFVVAIDPSFMDFVRSLPEQEAMRYMSLVTTLKCRDGSKRELIVLKWFSGLIPYSLMQYYDRLVERINAHDQTVFEELWQFCPKFLNSHDMITSVHTAPDNSTELKEQWAAWLAQAGEIHEEMKKGMEEAQQGFCSGA